MKKDLTYLIALFCVTAITFLSSCSEETKSEIQLSTLSLTTLKAGKEYIIDLERPRRLFAVQDGFVVFDDKNKNGLVQYYNETTDSVYYFGRLGNGPDDYTYPSCYQYGNKVILSSSTEKYSVLSFSNKGITCDNVVPFKSQSLFEGANFLSKIDDHTFVVSRTGDNQIEIIYDAEGGILPCSFYPFQVSDEVSLFSKNNEVFDATYAFNNESNLLFIGYKFYPYCMIVDMKSKKVLGSLKVDNERASNTYAITGEGGVEFDNPVLYNTFVCATKSHMWSLYQGCDRNELKKGASKSEIHKYALDGQSVERFSTDKSIVNFCVSHDGNYLYTLCLDEELEPTITRFDLQIKKS